MEVESRYKIIEKVGSGGMATVYRAMDTILNREVAIKVLHPHLVEKEEIRKRFLREAQAIARLRHKNIIEVYDYKSYGQTCYIISEFVRGKNLATFLSEYDISTPFVAAMIVSILSDAIGHAHDNGVIHRDIKPENILISSENILKITDFGIAHIADAESLTITGSISGSPAHMSPEQIDGKDVDLRTDIFSLGTLLYLISCGELPFKGNSPVSIFRSILMGEFVEPGQLNPLIGSRFSTIIHKALKKDLNERYSNAREIKLDLNEYLKEYGVLDVEREIRDFFSDPVRHMDELNVRISGHLKRRLLREIPSYQDKMQTQEFINVLLTLNPEDEEAQALFSRFRECSGSRSGRALYLFISLAIIVGFVSVFAVYRVYRAPLSEIYETGGSSDVLAVVASGGLTDDVTTAVVLDVGLREETADMVEEKEEGRWTKKERKRMGGRGRWQGRVSEEEEVNIPPAEGELRLFIKPYGDVYLDGSLLAKEKATLNIRTSVGKHTISVKNPFFFDIEREVDIRSGEKADLRLVFDKIKPAKIFINSSVDCDIYIDDSPMGRSDILMKNGITIPINAQNGRRRITVKAAREGYRDFTGTFEVIAGESRNIRINLQRLK